MKLGSYSYRRSLDSNNYDICLLIGVYSLVERLLETSDTGAKAVDEWITVCLQTTRLYVSIWLVS